MGNTFVWTACSTEIIPWVWLIQEMQHCCLLLSKPNRSKTLFITPSWWPLTLELLDEFQKCQLLNLQMHLIRWHVQLFFYDHPFYERKMSLCAKSTRVSWESRWLAASLLDVLLVPPCSFMQRQRRGCKWSAWAGGRCRRRIRVQKFAATHHKGCHIVSEHDRCS